MVIFSVNMRIKNLFTTPELIADLASMLASRMIPQTFTNLHSFIVVDKP